MLFTKAAMERGDIEVVAANDLMPFDSLANLFKHDSTHGIWPEDVSYDGNVLHVGDHEIKTFAERDPAQIPGATSAPISWSSQRASLRAVTAPRPTSKAGRRRSSSRLPVRVSTPPSSTRSTTRTTTQRPTRSSPMLRARPTALSRW